MPTALRGHAIKMQESHSKQWPWHQQLNYRCFVTDHFTSSRGVR